MKKIFLLFSLITVSLTFAQVPKMSIVEHFTNTRCAVCGYKNPPLYEVLDQYPDVIHIAYHPSSPYSACIFSQHNPEENDERTQFYGIYGSTPKVILNGASLPNQSPLVLPEDLDEAMDMMSDYDVQILQTEAGENQINVKVILKKIADNNLENISLYIAIAENEINYNAPNGETVHHQVFRLKLGEESINSIEVGETLEYNYSYSFHSDWQSDEMFAYAIVQDESKNVLQAGKSALVGDLTAIDDQLISSGLLNFSPNPTQNILQISNTSDVKFQDIRIFSVHGQLLFSQEFNNTINVGYLESGIYFLQLQSEEGKRYSFKMMKE
jgi:hypothetical protein